jgi:hypothetical protein
MFVVFRAITYAALFIGFLLIYLPARLLASAGIARPLTIAAPQIAGIIAGSIGASLALWCIFTFATIGKGTPAPFDPPRKLVIRGPYRFVRNPVHRRRPSFIRRRAVLQVSAAARVRRRVPRRLPSLRPRVRRTPAPPHVRLRLRSLLPARKPLVAGRASRAIDTRQLDATKFQSQFSAWVAAAHSL